MCYHIISLSISLILYLPHHTVALTQNKTPLVSLSEQLEHTALLQGADGLVVRVELVGVGVDQLHTAGSTRNVVDNVRVR